MTDKKTQRSQTGWYLLFGFGIVLLALAGYSGYVLYPRFNLPAVSGSGLLVLAAMASIASFFSPCSFPLLAGLLARETRKEKQGSGTALQPAFRFAAALSTGASLFLLLIGAGIALGGGVIFREVTFTSTPGRLIRIIVGVLLIIFGLIQVGVIPFRFGGVERVTQPIFTVQARLRRERPTLGFAIFGFGYLLTGFG
jgi:cytochrome c biogenesis protein CcdA